MTPLQRLKDLLKLDRKDVIQIFFYAIFAGIISLSLPLGIQAIINFIQAGRVSVSWIVLVFLVVMGVALVGILSLMQLRITENIQQKIFIRSSFDFAARMPKLKFTEIYDKYPPELANRFFDTMTLQKGTSKLLVDFSAALLQITFGLLLLSLYHPFFIIFGIMLFFLLYFIFKFSYSSGLQTSLNESKYKYKVAGWIQEMARNSYSFKNQENFDYGLQKNNTLVKDYLTNREKHFSVIKRQFSQLIVFKMIITASLLSIGGFLVINQQMNIGQFVAAEIIILLVINSVEKIILGLETLYDVLTSVEKIGQVTDMELEEEVIFEDQMCFSNITLETENLEFCFPDAKNNVLENINLKIMQGEKILLDGKNGSGKTTLIRILSGLLQPTAGQVTVNDNTFRNIDLKQYRSQIGTIVNGETPFEGTIMENITFNNKNIPPEKLRWALEGVKLSSVIKNLPLGLETRILPEGKQLSSTVLRKILIARSIINKPMILFYEDPTEDMDDPLDKEIIDFITDPHHKWSVVVTSKNPYWRTKCNRHITIESGTIAYESNT